MPDAATIVRILELGAVGLAFLFALLAFVLLRKEQGREKVRAPMLLSIRHYAYLQVIFFLLAVGANLVTGAFAPKPSPARIQECRDAVDRAETMAGLESTSRVGHQNALARVVIQCGLDR